MGVIGSTASEISAEIRAGRWSAEAVVREHLDFIRAEDWRFGAFRVIRVEAALTEARALDATPGMRDLPLAGVPIAVKDNVPVRGETTTHGSVAVAAGTAASSDHPVVARLRAAGAIVVGITRVPDLPQPTRACWLRPAACCGLVTLKPGRGTVPAGLGVGDWYGMAENGILATTVQDLSLGHSVLAGIPVPDLAARSGRALRIGTSVRSPLVGAPPDVDSRSGVDRAAAALAVLGHRVSPTRVPYPTSAALAIVLRWYAVAAADAGALRADPARLQTRTRRHAQLGRAATRLRLIRPGAVRSFEHRMRTLFDQIDILVTPVLTAPPPPARDWHRRGWLANVLTSSRVAPYPAVWNLVGFPAMSIPMGTRGDGLPLAVQVVGAPGSEARLLTVAAALEMECPWVRHAGNDAAQHRSS